ncbi:hypothetical protein [Myxococcus sp. Y35]|uniref:hypothetical protein n=1 Tax=Pseudomyxococcus flavus TaxID=3115648 RepID=UPI003CE86862
MAVSSNSPTGFIIAGAVFFGVLAFIIIAGRAEHARKVRIRTQGRRVKATLKTVGSGGPYVNGKPTTRMTFLVHEEGEGEDWLLEQKRNLSKPELFHLLVPGTVVDVMYDPAARQKDVLIFPFDGDASS